MIHYIILSYRRSEQRKNHRAHQSTRPIVRSQLCQLAYVGHTALHHSWITLFHTSLIFNFTHISPCPPPNTSFYFLWKVLPTWAQDWARNLPLGPSVGPNLVQGPDSQGKSVQRLPTGHSGLMCVGSTDELNLRSNRGDWT